MSEHLLRINMQVQDSDVRSALGNMQSQITKIMEQLHGFNRNLNNSSSLIERSAVAQEGLLQSISMVERTSQNVSISSLANLQHNLDLLKTYQDQATAISNTGSSVQGLARAAALRELTEGKVNAFLNRQTEFFNQHRDALDKITGQRVFLRQLSKQDLADADKIVKHLKSMKEQGVKLQDIHKDITEDKLKLWENSLKTINDRTINIGKHITNALPPVGKLSNMFTKLESILEIIGDEFKRQNKLYEDNHTVADIAINDTDNYANISRALAVAMNDAAGEGVLLEEAHKGVSAALQSSYNSAAQNVEALAKVAETTARVSRATGLEAKVVADLNLQYLALHKQQSNVDDLNAAIVNSTNKARFNQEQLAIVTGYLASEFVVLNNNYADAVDESGRVYKSSIVVTAQFAHLAEAAKKAGYDASAAMRIMADSMKDPVKHAILLQGALNEKNIDKRFYMIGQNAERFAQIMSQMGPVAASQFAKSLGYTQVELNGLAEGYRKTRDMALEYQRQQAALGHTIDMNAALQHVWTKQTKEATDKEAAAKKMDEARGDAIRRLNEVLDQILIIFGRIASVIQPVIEAFARFIQMIPGFEYLVVAVISLMAMQKVFGSLTGVVGSVVNVFGKLKSVMTGLGQATASVTKAGAAGANQSLKSFAKVFREAMDELSQVKWSGVIKSAAMIAIFGIALGVGVAALGLAAQLLPPDRAAELLVTILGIVAVMAVMILAAKYGGLSLAGALFVTLTAAALAAGVFFIGLAMKLVTIDQIWGLLAVTLALVGLMLVLALIGPIGPPALLGAALVALVGLALALGLLAIGAAMRIFPENALEIALSVVAMTAALALMAITGPLAVIGATAFAAAAIALAAGILVISSISDSANTVADVIAKLAESTSLIGPGVGVALASMAMGLVALAAALAGGSILSFFSGGFIDRAKELGAAMNILVGPIVKIGEVGTIVGDAFNHMADGLKKFVGILQEDAGWFTSFEEKARDIAKAISHMAGPIKEITQAQQGAVERSIRDAAQIQAEEIRSALSISINKEQDTNEEMLNILKKINTSIEKMGLGNTLEGKVGKIGETLANMLEEMMFSSGSGMSHSNNDYASP